MTEAATHPALTRCPVCGGELHIVRLSCDDCGTAIEGRFSGGRLQRLSREQLGFVEAFLRCRGKIKDVEQLLGVSYPTVVARLDEVVQALGFESDPTAAERAARRQEVLDELAAGTITVADAANKLRSL